MTSTTAAVLETNQAARKKLVQSLTRAGLKVTKAMKPELVKGERIVLLGPSLSQPAKVARAVRKRAPNAVVLQAQANVKRAAHADAVIPSPLSPKDLQARLPDLFALKKKHGAAKSAKKPAAATSATQSFLDPVTGFYPFPIFKELLFIEVKRARRYGLPLSIALAQLDASPDAKTAAVRNELMGGIAMAVRRTLRDTDFPVQFSTDRVLLVMTHTELAGALTVCQRICERTAHFATTFNHKVLRPTISVGIAAAATPGKELSVGDLVLNAQASLRAAVAAGGNRVEFYDRAAVDAPPETDSSPG